MNENKGIWFKCPKCGHEQIRNVSPNTPHPQYCPKHIAKDPLEFVPMVRLVVPNEKTVEAIKAAERGEVRPFKIPEQS